MNTDGFHSVHGRALPFALGAKLTNPKLNVVVISGDGDLFAIGGNHFLHAARRNVPMTVMCVNNNNFGMTGGQTAPTTPIGARTTTTPTGATLPPFNLVSVAAGAGAVYVARYTMVHVDPLTHALSNALRSGGFAFVEVIAPCHTLFGKYNQLGPPPKIVETLKERATRATTLELQDLRQATIGFDPKEGFLRVPIGEFVSYHHDSTTKGDNP
jgi:2-oxoglutarate ferredoxin oxidoreductase subunit beta